MRQKIPNSRIVIREDGKFIEKDIYEYFAEKKIVAFALPGAFTPTCSNYHVPAYEEEYENITALGVDEIYCISMNDPFVIEKWKELSHCKSFFLINC
jgi:peroxiredoxin